MVYIHSYTYQTCFYLYKQKQKKNCWVHVLFCWERGENKEVVKQTKHSYLYTVILTVNKFSKPMKHSYEVNSHTHFYTHTLHHNFYNISTHTTTMKEKEQNPCTITKQKKKRKRKRKRFSPFLLLLCQASLVHRFE